MSRFSKGLCDQHSKERDLLSIVQDPVELVYRCYVSVTKLFCRIPEALLLFEKRNNGNVCDVIQ